MNTTDFAVGIDLGTSTSELCIFRDGKPQPIPDIAPDNNSPIVLSIVGIDHRGNLVIGSKARGLAGRNKTELVREVKRQMGKSDKISLGKKQYLPEEIAAMILKQLKRNCEVYTGQSISDVVLTVPANFDNPAREATLRAGKMAGLNILRLLNEPTAAAMAFGIDHLDAEESIMVFDFGGGTLDITILEMMNGVMEVKHSYGDPQLGGKDFDEQLVYVILDKFREKHPDVSFSEKQKEILKNLAETAKITLSTEESAAVYHDNIGTNRKDEPVDLDVTITRNEFETACASLLHRTRDCVRKILKDSGCTPRSINRVLLVGGTTFIPAVQRVVTEEMGRPGRRDVNPMLAVSMGAAVEAGNICGIVKQEQALVKTDLTSFGLGIDVIFDVGGQRMLLYDELIPPQKTIPYEIEKEYKLQTLYQEQAEITLYQDYSTGSRFLEDKVALDKMFITDIPPSESEEPHTVTVTFSYDSNGIVQLAAKLPGTGKEAALSYAAGDNAMKNEDIQAAEKSLNKVFAEKMARELLNLSVLKSHAPYLQKVIEAVDGLNDKELDRLTKHLESLQNAAARNESATIEERVDELIDFLLDTEKKR